MINHFVRKIHFGLTISILLLSLVGCFISYEFRTLVEPQPSTELLFIVDTDLFDGTGDTIQHHMDIIVRDNLIEEVRPTGLPLPEGARAIDGRGKTLMPGLVDLHVHITSSPAAPWIAALPDVEHNLQAYLYSGVTTVYDMGGLLDNLLDIREQVANGEIPSPRIFMSGKAITAVDGHPASMIRARLSWPLSSYIVPRMCIEVETPEEATAAVDEMVAAGVDFIKLMCDEMPLGAAVISDELMKAVVDRAHHHGRKVVVHIGSTGNAISAVRAGADLLAHIPYKNDLTPEEVVEIVKSGILMTPTLDIWDRVDNLVSDAIEFPPLAHEISAAELLADFDDRQGAETMRGDELGLWGKVVYENRDVRSYNTQSLYAAGVTMMVGTDSSANSQIPGASIHEEMRKLADAGISNTDILLGVTSRPAAFLTDQPDFGTVEKGKVADLLLLDGNPLEDITATTRINLVVQGGIIIKRNRPQ
jgi:imidazolonepropionase-like amidohydrolase